MGQLFMGVSNEWRDVRSHMVGKVAVWSFLFLFLNWAVWSFQFIPFDIPLSLSSRFNKVIISIASYTYVLHSYITHWWCHRTRVFFYSSSYQSWQEDPGMWQSRIYLLWCSSAHPKLRKGSRSGVAFCRFGCVFGSRSKEKNDGRWKKNMTAKGLEPETSSLGHVGSCCKIKSSYITLVSMTHPQLYLIMAARENSTLINYSLIYTIMS